MGSVAHVIIAKRPIIKTVGGQRAIRENEAVPRLFRWHAAYPWAHVNTKSELMMIPGQKAGVVENDQNDQWLILVY